jgi:phosphoglycolate phosphatase-like HAD superfamily hydrolase
MIRNIIWDVDGTLFDTYPAIVGAFQAALRDFGCEVPANQISELAKISLGHCTSTMAGQYSINEDELGERFNAHYDEVKPEEQPPFPGVISICEYICSIGGKNLIVTHRGQAGTNELLENNQMGHLFAGAVTRTDGYAKKPDPAAFHAIIQMHNLHREETITIGDRGIDITAGQGAGLYSCFFGSSGSTADFTFDDFADLKAFIMTQNGGG